MHRRSWFAGIGLFAALLALALTALTPVALGESPAPSPEASATAPPGIPIITGTVPVTTSDEEKWTGDAVQVNFKPNGAEFGPDGQPLPDYGIDVEKVQLFIDGVEKELESARVIPIGGTTPTLRLVWGEPKLGKGTYDFRVMLVTLNGETLPVEWTATSAGEATGGSLINFEAMGKWWKFIAKGAFWTVSLTVVSIFFACIFALFGALGRLSKTMTFGQAWDRYHSRGYMVRLVIGRIPYWLATFYTSLFRGTPLLLQIMVIYLATPEVIRALGLPQSYNPSPFMSGVAALSLNYGAYLTEVFRAGIQAVPKGQNEAAWAIGLSGWQTQRRVVLPQAFKIVIPAVGNDFIALIKDTSLVSAITVEELLRKAQLAGAATLNNMSMFLVAAAFYWVLTIFFSFWQAKLETRMARDKAREKERR